MISAAGARALSYRNDNVDKNERTIAVDVIAKAVMDSALKGRQYTELRVSASSYDRHGYKPALETAQNLGYRVDIGTQLFTDEYKITLLWKSASEEVN